MKIDKKKINGYDLSIYKTDRYSSINFELLFQVPFTRENLIALDLLNEYMIHSTKKYPSRKAIDEATMDLYSFGFGLSNDYVGDTMTVEYFFGFVDPKLVQDDYFERAIEFASGIIFEPNFKNGHLDRDELKRCKEKIINSIGDEFLSHDSKARMSFYKSVFPDTYLTREYTSSKEEYEEILNSFTCEYLIDLYTKTFLKSFVGMIAMGNISAKEIAIVKKYFVFDEIKKLEVIDKVVAPIAKRPKKVTISDEESKESILSCVYDVPSNSAKDEVTYNAIISMLTSVGMLLHRVLRDEYKIVYNAQAYFSRKVKYICIRAFIDKGDEKAAIKGIEKTLKMLENPDVVEKELAKLKEWSKMRLYTYNENKHNPFRDLERITFKDDITIKEKIELEKTLSTQDIIAAVKKMKLVKVHFYRGDK